MLRLFYILYRVAEMLGSLCSRFVNAALLGGSTHQTTSSRAHLEWPRGRLLINAVFFWQDDHCKASWQTEVKHAKRTLEKAGIAATVKDMR
jgi:hypothetical protein